MVQLDLEMRDPHPNTVFCKWELAALFFVLFMQFLHNKYFNSNHRVESNQRPLDHNKGPKHCNILANKI